MIISSDFKANITDRYLLLDTNFLFLLFDKRNISLIDQFIRLTNDVGSKLLIEPQVKFEFIRGTYRPDLIAAKTAFLTNFYAADDHQEIYLKLKENALALSYAYSYDRNYHKASITDLILGARCMKLKNTLIITSNKNDFPSPIFKTMGILTHEDDNNEVTNYYLLAFNKEYFDKCIAKISQLRPPSGIQSPDLVF